MAKQYRAFFQDKTHYILAENRTNFTRKKRQKKCGSAIRQLRIEMLLPKKSGIH